MSFSWIPPWMACLLWCAGLACADGGTPFVGVGVDAWGKVAGGSVIMPAVCEIGPVKCAAKPRFIEPVWPHAIADENRLPAVAIVEGGSFQLRTNALDLAHARWVGVIELRV